jgi:hypothetical protein
MAYSAGSNEVDSIMVDIIDWLVIDLFARPGHNISYGESSTSYMLALFGFSVGVYSKRKVACVNPFKRACHEETEETS